MKKLSALVFCFVFAGVFPFVTGCAHYTIGTTLPKHLKTVYVETLRNQTGEPQIESSITAAILREFQRDGQLKVVDRDNADVLVTGTLTEYKLEPMRYDRNNPKKTREYRAIIRGNILVMDQVKGVPLAKQKVSGSTKLSAVGDLVTARRNALPDVSSDLGSEIVDAVISAWVPASKLVEPKNKASASKAQAPAPKAKTPAPRVKGIR